MTLNLEICPRGWTELRNGASLLFTVSSVLPSVGGEDKTDWESRTRGSSRGVASSEVLTPQRTKKSSLRWETHEAVIQRHSVV